MIYLDKTINKNNEPIIAIVNTTSGWLKLNVPITPEEYSELKRNQNFNFKLTYIYRDPHDKVFKQKSANEIKTMERVTKQCFVGEYRRPKFYPNEIIFEQVLKDGSFEHITLVNCDFQNTNLWFCAVVGIPIALSSKLTKITNNFI